MADLSHAAMHPAIRRGRKTALKTASVLALFLLSGSAQVLSQPPAQADILIKGGEVVDGTGGPWVRADVAIRGDRIVYVGRAPVTAKRVIDATGKVVSPGFIDMHSHSEFGLSLDLSLIHISEPT